MWIVQSKGFIFYSEYMHIYSSLLLLVNCYFKESGQGFCCLTVKILSLEESIKAGAFWCHEFQWSMKRQLIVKKNYIRIFSWMLDYLLQKVCFQHNWWIKQNTYWVKHFTIAFIVLSLYDYTSKYMLSLSSHSLTPFHLESYLLYLAAFEQLPSLPNEGEGKFLDDIFLIVISSFL